MQKTHLVIQIVIVFFFSSISWADHSMVPCDYVIDIVPPIETSEKIFDSLLIDKVNQSPKDTLAYLRLTPSFDPEVVFTITARGDKFYIQKNTASDNVFASIQIVATDNKINFYDMSKSDSDNILKSLNKTISFTTKEKNISKKLARHILDNFNFQLANSRNPTETEAKEIFNQLDGHAFYFKSSSDKCFMGLPTMQPPAKQLIDIVMLLTELFETTGGKSEEVTRKIMAITH